MFFSSRPQELAVAVEAELEEPPHCRGSLHNCSQVSLFKKLQHGGNAAQGRMECKISPNYPIEWASPWPAPSCAPSCAKPNGSSNLPSGAAAPSPNAQEFPLHRRCSLYETIRKSLSNSRTRRRSRTRRIRSEPRSMCTFKVGFFAKPFGHSSMTAYDSYA